MEKLTFYREFESAITPQKGSEGAAGLDIFIPSPTTASDEVFDFMKNKCLASTDDVVAKKSIEMRFDSFKSMDPEKAFWEAVVLYNIYCFKQKKRYVHSSLDNNFRQYRLELNHGEKITIPTGLSASIPHGYALDFLNKSGIASKAGLQIGAELIDEDYKGIMHMNVACNSSESAYLTCGMKLVQAILIKTYYDEVEVECVRGKINETSERGDGGFGSTGA